MAYTLGNNCAKNLCKRTVLLQFIIKNVVTCFFLEHSVDKLLPRLSRMMTSARLRVTVTADRLHPSGCDTMGSYRY